MMQAPSASAIVLFKPLENIDLFLLTDVVIQMILASRTTLWA